MTAFLDFASRRLDAVIFVVVLALVLIGAAVLVINILLDDGRARRARVARSQAIRSIAHHITYHYTPAPPPKLPDFSSVSEDELVILPLAAPLGNDEP
jgi:hypothetical protein